MTDRYFSNPRYARQSGAEAAAAEAAEAQRIVEARRAKRAAQHEAELRSAYLSVPGADEAGWEREKSTILAADREAAALGRQDAARAAAARFYRDF